MPNSNNTNPTIKDIARLANVSIGTVSNYLNKTARVSERTSDSIESAIRELGYQPNFTARSLRLQQTQSLGLVLPNISNPFFAEIARLISQCAWKSGFQILLSDSVNDPIREKAQLRTLYQRQVDGVIIIHTGDDSISEIVDSSSTPTVFIDRKLEHYPSIITDNHLGGRLSMQHLVDLGHRRIAIISGGREINNVKERLAGAYDILSENGLTVLPEHEIHGEQSIETGLRSRVFWQLDNPPTAIFTTNDVIALGVWQTCLAEHIAIPQQVSIVGFDNIQWSSLMVPPLTTVAQNVDEISKQAINAILDFVQNDKAIPNTIAYVEPELVVRASTQSPI